MARRLAPEARKREILDKTRQRLAQEGPEGLSLRSVARWCGMSAPGILHYFDSLAELLEQVLIEHDAEELAAATDFVESLGADGTLRDFADGLVRHIQANSLEAHNYDALEIQALAMPDHPARNYFLYMLVRPLPPAVELARREYSDPDTVITTLRIVVDGLRHRWLRTDDVPDYWADWLAIRDIVFDGLEPLRKRTD